MVEDYIWNRNYRAFDEVEAALIIDGQDRLFAADPFDPDFPLKVVAILDSSDLEIAFQFLEINNKARKVQVDHVRLNPLTVVNDLTKRPWTGEWV